MKTETTNASAPAVGTHPTPWGLDFSSGVYRILAADGLPVVEFFGNHERDAEHARLIVRAVNSHADLLAALRLLKAAENATIDGFGETQIGELEAAMKQAEKAIAKATNAA